MIRKRVEWKFRGSSLTLGERTLVVGILNVTPDSFSDGGKYDDPNAAVKRAVELQEQGADIIDIGAESTRPGSERISEAEELRRLIPVLKRLKGKIDIPISVDTYKAAVAETALEHGASIINDVSGLVWEPDLAKTVRDGDAGLILNHMRGKPEEWARLSPMRDVMGEIAAELEAAVHRARKAGVEQDHIVIDPGIGFGKRKEQNSELLARLGELRRLLVPIMVGPSRKLFLNQEDPRLADFATAGAVATAILNGACMVRVHDVSAIKAVVATVDAIIDATPEREEEERPKRSAREATRERDQKEADRKKPVRPPLIGGPKKPVEPVLPPPSESASEQPRGERPAYSRPPRDRGQDREERRPFRDRGEDRGERRPPFRDLGDERGERRPPMRGRSDDRGERRPPFRDRGDERGERRPPMRGRSDDRGEGRPPFRGRGEERGEGRPPMRGRGDDRGDRRPPFRGRGEDRGEGRPPFRGREDDRGERRPPFRGRGEERGEGRPPMRGRGDDRGERRPPTRGRGEDSGERRPPFRGKSDDDRRPPGGRPPSRGPGGPKGPGRGGPKGGGGRGPSTPRRRG